MQAACTQCGARYEFDSSAIPPEGYDARCTNCNSVFFVAPEGPPGQVAIACQNCGTVYQFAATDIPAGGYDAQCTQCHAVFFVSADGSAVAPSTPPAPPTVAQPTAAAPPMPQPGTVPVSPVVGGVSPAAAPIEVVDAEPMELEPLRQTPVELGTPNTSGPVALQPLAAGGAVPAASMPGVPGQPLSQPQAQARPPVPQAAAAPPTRDSWEEPDPATAAQDLMALGAALGEPEASPDGFSPETDFEAILQRRRRRLLFAGALVGLVVLYGVVTYVALPVVFDATLGPVLGIKAAVNPAAIPLMKKGRARMWDDTAAAYSAAEKDFAAAMKVDDQYPEAIALAAIGHVFRGTDIQRRGRAMQKHAAALIDEIKTLHKGPKLPRGAEARIAKLQAQVADLSQRSTKIFEQGGDELKKAEALLDPALHTMSSSGMVVLASGLYIASDPEEGYQATKRLQQAMDRLQKPGTALDLKNPPNAWAPFLKGEIAASSKSGQADAVAAFRAAVKKEPRFQRARYELARVLLAQGKTEQAEALAHQILKAVPAHAKAKALLTEVAAASRAKAETPAVKTAAAKMPTARGRSRRGRRGRRHRRRRHRR